jgi:hypothetical protein
VNELRFGSKRFDITGTFYKTSYTGCFLSITHGEKNCPTVKYRPLWNVELLLLESEMFCRVCVTFRITVFLCFIYSPEFYLLENRTFWKNISVFHFQVWEDVHLLVGSIE